MIVLGRGRLGNNRILSPLDCHGRRFRRPAKEPKAPPAETRPKPAPPPAEIGGPKGPSDPFTASWEVNGRCTDF